MKNPPAELPLPPASQTERYGSMNGHQWKAMFDNNAEKGKPSWIWAVRSNRTGGIEFMGKEFSRNSAVNAAQEQCTWNKDRALIARALYE